MTLYELIHKFSSFDLLVKPQAGAHSGGGHYAMVTDKIMHKTSSGPKVC